MNYPGEFKERAQIEMSKRLGLTLNPSALKQIGL